jgi:hypothetical protein
VSAELNNMKKNKQRSKRTKPLESNRKGKERGGKGGGRKEGRKEERKEGRKERKLKTVPGSINKQQIKHHFWRQNYWFQSQFWSSLCHLGQVC